MDKQTTARAAATTVAAAFTFEQEEPCPFGAGVFFVGLNYSRPQLSILSPTPREVNSPSAFRAGSFSEDENIHQVAPQLPWQPIELVGHHTWEQYIGHPMVQDVRGTCALVASIKCVEAVHRLQHEKLHRTGIPFPYSAAPPCHLFEACRTDGIWKAGVGAKVRDVLNKIRKMGGVLATATTGEPSPTQCFLPLRSWEEHRWDDYAATALSPGRVAQLLYNNGPCIGQLWTSRNYRSYDADSHDARVYTSGFARSDDARRSEMEERYPGVGWHAVVCVGFRNGGRDVLVLDNQTPTGPWRWIDSEEFHAIYTVSVAPLCDHR